MENKPFMKGEAPNYQLGGAAPSLLISFARYQLREVDCSLQSNSKKGDMFCL